MAGFTFTQELAQCAALETCSVIPMMSGSCHPLAPIFWKFDSLDLMTSMKKQMSFFVMLNSTIGCLQNFS